MMNNINDSQNIVNLLKEALKFYADKNNYFSATDKPSNIYLDEYGSQARFALNKATELEELIKKSEDEYLKNIANVIDQNNNVIFDYIKKINEINKNEI